jgi:putative transposase
MKIWISTDEAMKSTGWTRQWIFKKIKRAEIIARAGARAARNGRCRTEILLESLPVEAQEKYSKRSRVNLLPVPFRNEQPPPAALLSLNEQGLDRVNLLAETLRKISSATNKKAEKRFIARELSVTTRTVENRLKSLQAGGLAALARKKRADAGTSRVADTQVIGRIQSEYLQTHRPLIAQIHRTIEKDYRLSGLDPPSYEFVRAVIKKIDPDLVKMYRFGERAFDDRVAYITLRQKPDRPFQWVQADHHPCDHNVVFPDCKQGRPWITLFFDVCTNMVLAFRLTKEKPVAKGTYPGALAIGLTLRDALLRKDDPEWPSCGVFEHLQVDLGKDFRSKYVRAVCADLGIEINYTRGYHGKSKGNIEGWFRIMEDGTRGLLGYCGNKPGNNPERQRLKPKPLNANGLLFIDDYEREIRDWIVNDYHRRASRALGGLSPLEALAKHVKNGLVVRELRNERVFDLLLMRQAKKLVRNAGIQHFNRFFFAPELLPIIGQHVDVRWDPGKAWQLLIYKDDRFICTVTNRELVKYGASEETLDRERELKRQQKKSLAERYERMITQAQYSNDLARAAAEERDKKMLQFELRSAVGEAQAPGVPALIPKYHRTAKKLRLAVVSASSCLTPNAAEENPWLHREPEATAETIPEKLPKSCHKCGSSESFLHCSDCSIEGSCPECGGSGAHRYCSDCFREHDHTNPGVCHQCGNRDSELKDCFNCSRSRDDQITKWACPKCHGISLHRYCARCIGSHGHKADSEQLIERLDAPYSDEND